MLYAVCTQCAFLRVFAEPAGERHVPESCPACGGELMASRGEDRFEPTYLGKASLELHSATPITPSM